MQSHFLFCCLIDDVNQHLYNLYWSCITNSPPLIIPRPPPFFFFNLHSQKWKNSKIRDYSPCEVDTRCMYGRAVVLTVKLSIQHSWSREQLGFCLAVEHSMTKSIECNPPTSTSCPPDINHVISILSPSTFLRLICFCVLLLTQTHYGQKSNKIYWTHFVW